MRTHSQVLATVALVFMMCDGGCKSNGSNDHAANTPPKQANPPPQPVNPPPKAEAPPSKPPAKTADQQSQIRKYEGPPANVSMLQLQTFPPQNNVGVEIRVKTGGWTLELDKGEIINRVAKVYFTLERPGDGEMVTQSLETLQGNFKTLEEITSSEIYIHMAQRGVSTFTTDYRLAATGQ